MKTTKSYRFSTSMTKNIKWLANEFNTTETEILELLITYATCEHDNFIEDGIKSDIEVYLQFYLKGTDKE